MGGFDLDAAQAVAGGGDVERYQVLDQLTLLVDKSLVVAEDASGRTRYRLLETVRQYALEKLGESGEADAVRARHRDHYTAIGGVLDAPAGTDHERHLEQAEAEIDNLRAAFAWSRENSDTELALALASSLQPLWLARGRIREGLAWFDAALTDDDEQDAEVAPAVRARALADKAMLDAYAGAADSVEQAQHALAIARGRRRPGPAGTGADRVRFARGYNAELAATVLRRGDRPGPLLGDNGGSARYSAWQAYAAIIAGDPIATRAAAEEGRDLADAIGDRFISRHCRVALALRTGSTGDLAGAIAQLREVVAEAEAAHDVSRACSALLISALVLACQGDAAAARAAANAGRRGRRRTWRVRPGLCLPGVGCRGPGRRRRRARRTTRVAAGLRRRQAPAQASGVGLLTAWPRPRWRAGIWPLPDAGPTTPSRQRPAGTCRWR